MNIQNLKICLTIDMVIGHKPTPPSPSWMCCIFFISQRSVKDIKGSHKVVKRRNPEAQGDKVNLAFFFIYSLSNIEVIS